VSGDLDLRTFWQVSGSCYTQLPSTNRALPLPPAFLKVLQKAFWLAQALQALPVSMLHVQHPISIVFSFDPNHYQD